MPDISMCVDDKCPTRRQCYRHQASGTIPDRYQSFYHPERKESDEKCEDYIAKKSPYC